MIIYFLFLDHTFFLINDSILLFLKAIFFFGSFFKIIKGIILLILLICRDLKRKPVVGLYHLLVRRRAPWIAKEVAH